MLCLNGRHFGLRSGSKYLLIHTRSQSSQPSPKDLEKKWTKIWRDLSPTNSLHPTKHLSEENSPKYYGLTMFPYPSGLLHLGHLRVYTISDVVARYKRLKGFNVIHPMGWDAFGLPAENAAVERGIDPAVWTDTNIEKMKEQMGLMLADFDWDRELSTCSPDYYKWTQKIFLLLHEHGLAYRKNAEINWDPVDKTVLANEQVDAEGRSWRSGAIVEKKNLEQWFIGITKYAHDLNKDLKLLNEWPDKVKTMQKNWIGESTGAEIIFPTTNQNIPELTVFTSRPDTLFSVQFLAISVSHPLVTEYITKDAHLREFLDKVKDAESDSKEGYLLPGVQVSIPMDQKNNKSSKYNVPVYVAPYVLGTYGHGAVMGCPGHDERDYDFWTKHNPTKPIIQVVGSKDVNDIVDLPFTKKDGILYNRSVLKATGVEDIGEYEGKTVKQAGSSIVHNLQSIGLGGKSTQYKIRDWLISRQRYWGAPIPMIHCHDCGIVPVPDKDLPVLLPSTEGFEFGKGNPLEKAESFLNVECPSCGEHAKRDTDTMDTFMDSSWYFFRYLDSKNDNVPFDSKVVSKSMPVDMYIGGVEHAILHLLYTRFISKFLGDIGLWNGEQVNNEPIKKLVTQGMVQGKTYKDPDNDRFLKPEEIDLSDSKNPRVKATGKIANSSYEKMSKSKYNGVDPGECISKYGADTVRAHMLFQAPVSDILNWNEEQIVGVDRWLKKVTNLQSQIADKLSATVNVGNKEIELHNVEVQGQVKESYSFTKAEFELFKDVQSHLKDISEAIEIDLSLNTVISDLMKFTNRIIAAVKSEDAYSQDILIDAYKKLLISMSPVTPCTSEECWELLSKLENKEWSSILNEKFPNIKTIESQFAVYNIFINGRARASFEQSKDFISLSESDILKEIKNYGNIKELIKNKEIKRIIIKPGMISLVLAK
ncbi:hypothetical protein DFJ63DRAFT_311900 [Scheffersomyces coipomensis]|uniref:uncharacterized protein n=1 Tax=Scheffersomyces coipomensis TaxID=1788519 RepID=UPI00315C9FB9